MTVVRAEQGELVTGGPAQTNGQVLASSALRQFAADGAAAMEIALSIAPTPFVPSSYKTGKHWVNNELTDVWYDPQKVAQNVAAAWLAGDEIGLKPMQALQAIDIIEGRPALNARSMRALVQAHGHEIWIEEQPDPNAPNERLSATVAGRRKGSEHIERVVWTWQRAEKQKLTNKKNWIKGAPDMLIARGTSAIARLIAADVLMGLAYSQEELQDELESSEDAPVAVRRASVARRTQPEADPFEGPDLPADVVSPPGDKPGDGPVAESWEDDPHAFAGVGPSCERCGRHRGEDGYAHTDDESEQPQEDVVAQCEEVAGDGRRCKREAGHENRHYFGPRSEAPASQPEQRPAQPWATGGPDAGVAVQSGEAFNGPAVADFTPSPEEAAAADEGPDDGDDGLFPDVSEEEQEAAFVAEQEARAREAAQAAAGVPAGDPVGEPGGTAGPEHAAPAGNAEDDDPWADFR